MIDRFRTRRVVSAAVVVAASLFAAAVPAGAEPRIAAAPGRAAGSHPATGSRSPAAPGTAATPDAATRPDAAAGSGSPAAPGSAAAPGAAAHGHDAAPRFAAPPGNAGFDYQIGAPYPPPAGVRVVSRDRTAEPAAGAYTICYVNAYQAQPGELGWWRANHDDLLLHDANGNEVVDSDWGEVLLDTSTAAKRTALAGIVGGWLDGCAGNGFRAVEPDNLDSWTRSRKLLDRADALAYARLLTARAHADGLAIGQKNTAEVSDVGRRTGFDFAVAEECAEYDECGDYTAAYGDEVFVVEYDRAGFRKACTDVGDRLSVVLRDRDVTAPGSPTYVYDAC